MKEINTICALCRMKEETTVIGDKPCKKCQEDMLQGFLLIGVDFSKSDSAENPARTGHRWVMNKNSSHLTDLYKPETIEKGAGFIDIEDARQIGLPVQTSPLKPK